MPIQINLLAEAQGAEEQRRKDPVKRVFYGAGFGVFLVLLWATTLQLKLVTRGSQLSSLQSQWESIETDYEKVVAKQREAIEAEEKLIALDRLTTNRFLWAPALNALQQSMNGIENLEVVRLKGEQQYKRIEEAGPRGPDGKETPKKVTCTERIGLMIEATDYNTQSGGAHNRFKEAIANIPYFQENLLHTNGVRLITLSPPQSSGAYGPSFVRFSLQCVYPERVR